MLNRNVFLSSLLVVLASCGGTQAPATTAPSAEGGSAAGGAAAPAAAKKPARVTKAAPAPNGIEMPPGYESWQVVAVSNRSDNNTLRVVVGNDVAMQAIRDGKTNPWPEGAILGKMVWKKKTLDTFDKAEVPDAFVHAEFMIKDAKKWASTDGWGYARWKGMEYTVHGTGPEFAMECATCHTKAKERDFVFTLPAKLPL